MPVQAQRAFDLVESCGDGRVVGVVAFRSDGYALVVVHVWLDARRGAAVPATVIRSNDWTRRFAGAAVAASTVCLERNKGRASVMRGPVRWWVTVFASAPLGRWPLVAADGWYPGHWDRTPSIWFNGDARCCIPRSAFDFPMQSTVDRPGCVPAD